MSDDQILVSSQPTENTFLHRKTKEVELTEFSTVAVQLILKRMRKIMRKANGIGLSANQIGLSYRLFIAEVPARDGKLKFYAVFNPKIEKYSEDKDFLEEGCLSVPGAYGQVERSLEVVLRGFDKRGKAVKIKAWGLLAHVFQHEVDHLDGKLFIEKAKNIQHVPSSERFKKKVFEEEKD